MLIPKLFFSFSLKFGTQTFREMVSVVECFGFGMNVGLNRGSM
jgi:hypothetical protein